MLYGPVRSDRTGTERCVPIAYSSAAWDIFSSDRDVNRSVTIDRLPVVLPHGPDGDRSGGSLWDFDIIANAFYFLSSWSERLESSAGASRGLYRDSVFKRLQVPQDIVDRYMQSLLEALDLLCVRLGSSGWQPSQWPNESSYAVVLSHDIDFVPAGWLDNARQGVKTFLRHLIRERRPIDALRAGWGFLRATATGRDPYGCVPEIIAIEQALDVKASFQVAVGHRHPVDVNYHVESDRIRDYLRTIQDNDFELCLHGSYRSTENPDWYAEEVALLAERLTRPVGSRQHYLSFHYDSLFRAQERTGITYDMSLGFPDQPGARAGFSYPYFPWCLEEERPYNVLQISLFLMDVTLRSYMNLSAKAAWKVIEAELVALRAKGGGVSVVWHPIVFGKARDPGYDDLFWSMVRYVQDTGGLATDGRTINDFWRRRARAYPSFTRIG